MADKEFTYDPEGEDESGGTKFRLPFGLCKSHGIKIQDWWTPKDAWEALRNGGYVKDVSEEYKKHYKKLKAEKAKARNKKKKERRKAIAAQSALAEHNPDKNYIHKPGAIAGAQKGARMTFKEADSGNCNPYYGKGFIGYKTNCQTCVAVYVARRNGYNVRALPNLNNKDIRDLSYQPNLAYLDSYGNAPNMKYKTKWAKTDSWLSNQMKDGDMYAIRGTWKGRNCGHIIVVEKIKGQMRYYDPQINETYNSKEAQSQIFKSMKDIRAFDVTNVKLNEKFCDKIMKGNNP